jgi:transcriptional regulator with XRE-family HTH domain
MTGEELKSWRQKRQLTQEKLAQLLGIHRVTIAKWEAGVRGIPSLLSLALEALENRLKKEEKSNGVHQ